MFRTGLVLILLLTELLVSAQQQSLVYQVRFERNKHELSSRNKGLLSVIYNTLAGKKGYIIYINGHADSDADSSYNQQLSLKRSLSVKEFLVEKGIEDSLIRVRAMGEEQPLVANTTPIEKAKNRRVELLVLFQQVSEEKDIKPERELVNIINVEGCDGDTTVTLENGYKLTLSNCDWERNSHCLRVEKKFNYKIKIRENWLKKHIGFKNYKKVISYEPHYEFVVVSCLDSCFRKPVKLYIPQYDVPGLKAGFRFSQKKNDKGSRSGLTFKKAKLGDSAYYLASIYCPGFFDCTDGRCFHLVNLEAKNKISILSYSYYVRSRSSYFDSLVEAKPTSPDRLTDNYNHAFFHTLTILYKGDTITLKNIPIDVFAHGRKKIKTMGSKYEKVYFLFIPFRKKYKCGHYKKYKIRAKDIENLRQFNILDLEIEN
jgi:OmpA family